VRESGRAKRLSIKVYPRGRVEVVVPRRTRPHDVQSFVDEHRDWIEQTRASFAAKHPPEPFALPGRVWLAAIGRSFRVAYRPRKDVGTVRFRRHGDLLALTGETSDEAQCIAALKRWLAIVAKEEFEPWLRALSARTGDSFKRMQVRGQKTCWGSHSSTGAVPGARAGPLPYGPRIVSRPPHEPLAPLLARGRAARARLRASRPRVGRILVEDSRMVMYLLTIT
jgi:predicted metal-dependent hydrolase